MGRIIYQKCKLVHADLSEYNILYHKGHLYFIDVSQAVEHDHPNALRFLQMDCTNMTAYFRRQGIPTMTVRELSDFITDMTLTDDGVDDYLENLQQQISSRPVELTSEQQMDEEVFKQTFIPRTLNDVLDHERHIIRAQEGLTKDMFYKSVVGLDDDYLGKKDAEKESVEDAEEGEEGEEEEEGEEGETPAERQARLETMDRKERKQLVKEQKREKRKDKVPKHVKKRRKKVNKQSSKK